MSINRIDINTPDIAINTAIKIHFVFVVITIAYILIEGGIHITHNLRG